MSERQAEENTVNKPWTCIGGLLTGAVSVFAVATVAMALGPREMCSAKTIPNNKDMLALPEGENI